MRRSELGLPAAGLACIAGVALVVAAAHESGNAESSPLTPDGAWRPLLYVGLIGAFTAYVFGCWLSARSTRRLSIVAAIAAIVQLVPLAGPLLLSSDATSYTTYGKADDPYVHHAGWATSSVYGPLWTFISEPIAHLAHPEYGFRVLAAVCTLGIAACAARLAVNRVAMLAFVGWNPLLALHGAGGGHNDALMILLVAAALVLERSGQIELAGAAWAVSMWIKWVPIVFFALWVVMRVRRRQPIGLRGFIAANVILVAGSFARWGTHWLHVFSIAGNEARRPSSIGLPAWLGHVGIPHRIALVLVTVAFLIMLAWLVRTTWRGRLDLGLAGGAFALAQERLNPWFGTWAIGLSSETRASKLFAVAFTAVLLADVLPR